MIFIPFLLIFFRMSALLGVAPMFAGNVVPVRFRILLAAVLSLMIGVHQMPGAEVSWNVTTFFAAGLGEILLGGMLGACVLMVFCALSVAGSAISFTSGLTFPVESGLTKESQPIIAQIFYTLGLAAIFASGGHRLVLTALMQTFRTYPPGMIAWQPDMFQAVMETFYLGFSLGVHLALPVLFLLLAAHLVLAILHRVMPQINTFSLSFPLNTLLVLGILGVTVGGSMLIFETNFVKILQFVVCGL